MVKARGPLVAPAVGEPPVGACNGNILVRAFPLGRANDGSSVVGDGVRAIAASPREKA